MGVKYELRNSLWTASDGIVKGVNIMDQKIIDRMVAFVREVAGGGYRNSSVPELTATEIMKLIDPPVDPDLPAAHRICETLYSKEHGLFRSFLDKDLYVRSALDGIKYGKSDSCGFYDGSFLGHTDYPKHTVPPVDQDLIDAREICAAVSEEWGHFNQAKRYREGTYDADGELLLVLQHLRDRREP